jgi:hypothetical protein
MSKTATLKFNDKTSKWEASYAGQVFLKSASKDYVVDKIVNKISAKAVALGITAVEEFGSSLTEIAVAAGIKSEPEITFGIVERFNILEDLVDMVATRTIPSVVVAGTGGLGKSHRVIKALRRAGLKQVSLTEIKTKKMMAAEDSEDGDDDIVEVPVNVEEERKSFIVVKGFSTAKAMYRTMWENRHKVIVFDDCDVTKDPVGTDILKAALDSYDERIVSWGAEGFIDDGLPRAFEFCGGVVFITNKPLYKLPQPIISRSMVADVSMTRAECVELMRDIVMNSGGDDVFMPQYAQSVKIEALEFIAKYAEHPQVKDVNLRTLIGVTKSLIAKPAHWERLALYSMINSH